MWLSLNRSNRLCWDRRAAALIARPLPVYAGRAQAGSAWMCYPDAAATMIRSKSGV
jgi:hypothetical protein